MTIGLNHITFAVTDVPRAVAFYEHVIGCSKVATWDEGACLRAGEAWLCLSRDVAAAAVARGDYTHTAFTFDAAGLVIHAPGPRAGPG
jgi:catechol 2,3-dioxygenase-like lactoylglutathione lyase family enzyme